MMQATETATTATTETVDIQRIQTALRLAVVLDRIRSERIRSEVIERRIERKNQPKATEPELIGYRLMADNGLVRPITAMAYLVANDYSAIDPAEVVERTLARFARWLASRETETANIYLADPKRSSYVARSMARKICRRLGTGRGSMPSNRDMERVERHPMHSYWLDSHGVPIPSAGSPVPFRNVPLGRPEDALTATIDMAALRLANASITAASAYLLTAAMDRLRITSYHKDGVDHVSSRIDWNGLADDYATYTRTAPLHRTTLQRKLKVIATTVLRDRDNVSLSATSTALRINGQPKRHDCRSNGHCEHMPLMTPRRQRDRFWQVSTATECALIDSQLAVIDNDSEYGSRRKSTYRHTATGSHGLATWRIEPMVGPLPEETETEDGRTATIMAAIMAAIG